MKTTTKTAKLSLNKTVISKLNSFSDHQVKNRRAARNLSITTLTGGF